MGSLRRGVVGLLIAAAVAAGGCVHHHRAEVSPPLDVPNERQKVVLPEYMIESPDLLQIDLLYAVPQPPYRIQPLDVLNVVIANPLDEKEPLGGLLQVEADGTINLGGRYRSVPVAGLTPADARAAVQKHLDDIVKDIKVTGVTVAEGRGVQLIRGPHLVRPDGVVALGAYGSVAVAGLTVREAKAAIESHLKKFLQSPEVVVSVIGYNSKVYYVVFDLGGAGYQVQRQPITGNETVLDAISQANGLTSVSDPRRVWVARSSKCGEPDLILPVDWWSLTARGRAETNYQLQPGDRLFVQAYPLSAVDTKMARMLAPFERVFGFSLLGTTTYQEIRAAVKGQTTTGGIGF